MTDEASDLLKFTLDHVGAYVYTKDMEGRYTFANAMVCELFGRPFEQVVGRPDDDFFDLSIAEELRKNDSKVIENGERLEREERNIIATTGEERFYWSVKLPIRDNKGQITGLCGISTDITERKRLEQELKSQKDMLSLVLENMDSNVYMKGKDRKFRYVNTKTACGFGRAVDDIVGKTGLEFLSKKVADHFEASDRIVLEEARKVALEESSVRPDGSEEHFWSIKIPLMKDGQVDGLIGMSTDITEIINLRNRFETFARKDDLTGVLTRRFLIAQAEEELSRAQRRGAQIGALVLDVDYLKQINDKHGHATGDQYILAVTEICQNLIRDGEFIGRLGGDEFVLMITDVDQAGLQSAAQRFHDAMSAGSLNLPDDQTILLSVSLGAALSTAESDLDMLLAHADRALYEAKRAGRGCWRIFGCGV